MHERSDRLTRAVIAALVAKLPGELVAVNVVTSEDVTQSVSAPDFYTRLGAIFDKEFGTTEFVPEPTTHNERSARRQATASAGETHVPIHDPEDAKRVLHFARKEEAPEPEVEPESEDKPEIDATDAARKEAEAAGVDLADVIGTGSGGRITVEDVRLFVEASGVNA